MHRRNCGSRFGSPFGSDARTIRRTFVPVIFPPTASITRHAAAYDSFKN
jgi:hypothetical protein